MSENEDNEVIFSEIISESGTEKKVLSRVHFKGKWYLSLKKMWRESTNDTWKYSKAIVNLKKDEFEFMVETFSKVMTPEIMNKGLKTISEIIFGNGKEI